MNASESTVGQEMPVYARWDLVPVLGSGCRVKAEDGREFLDFYGAHATAVLGYGNPLLLATLEDQAEALFFQTNAAALRVRERAVAALVGFAPPGLSQVFFVNSGAEANENALRLAFRHTGRSKVLAVTDGFHGRTAAAAACTFGADRWYAFPRKPFDVEFVPKDDARALAAAIDGDTAAVIVEAVQGVAGAYPLSTEFLRVARERTSEEGALLIADEIQCGMGRCGVPFAIMASDVVPDILTSAKGIAGGFPASAVLARADVVKGLGVGDLGTTFGGGPLACALIVAVVERLSSPGFLERVRSLSELIQRTCRVGSVTEIQGAGLLLGLRTTRPAKEVLKGLQVRGILAGGASDPHIVRLLPPLVITEDDVAQLAAALLEIN